MASQSRTSPLLPDDTALGLMTRSELQTQMAPYYGVRVRPG